MLEIDKAKVAGMFLVKDAFGWMDARKTAGTLPTDWTGFKTAFLEEFYPKNDISQARVELSKLKLRKVQEMKSHIALNTETL